MHVEFFGGCLNLRRKKDGVYCPSWDQWTFDGRTNLRWQANQHQPFTFITLQSTGWWMLNGIFPFFPCFLFPKAWLFLGFSEWALRRLLVRWDSLPAGKYQFARKSIRFPHKLIDLAFEISLWLLRLLLFGNGGLGSDGGEGCRDVAS